MIDADHILLPSGRKSSIPIHIVNRENLSGALGKIEGALQAARALGFDAQPLVVLPVLSKRGGLSHILTGAPSQADAFALGSLASKLPPGAYHFADPPPLPDLVALGWCLDLYKYDPYRAVKINQAQLSVPKGIDRSRIVQLANATYKVRDLVNAPANLMGPSELEAAARIVAKSGKTNIRVIKGDALKRGFPLIHAVGAAAEHPPRLVDFIWGRARDPKITLVGKGVCFDTGGLDIKPSSNMLLMKKDMGGAANVLGLAQLIMAAKLPVRLRVLLPIVENSISDEAFRPGDVFKSRKGLTVEIGNTDAEGRLILADALALADEEAPELLIDMATLTGAARVALGPDLPPFYTDDDTLASNIMKNGFAVNDPVWRLPLWRPYADMIATPIADLNNAGQGGFAGSITAALFLRRFVEKAKHHVHFDIFAWTPTAKAGRPKGGEAQAMRALFSLLVSRYKK